MDLSDERLLSDDVALVRLGAPGAPGTEVVSGDPTAASRTLAKLGDVEIGVWEMTTGVARDVEVDEVFVVVAGTGEVRFADGRTITLAPGVAVHLRAGDHTEWTIREALRKVYVARG